MLWLGSWIVLFVFCYYAVRLARNDSLWLALGFVVAWFSGRIGLSLFGIEGAIYFISFAAVLSLIMIFIDRYRDEMGLRSPTNGLTNSECDKTDGE